MSLLPLVLAFTPAADPAVDWWWVQGDPQDAAITFADARSIRRVGADATVRTLVIDRTGQTLERVLTVRCPAREAEGPARFACGTEDDRMTWAAMLGPTAPREAAGALFVSGERGGRVPMAD